LSSPIEQTPPGFLHGWTVPPQRVLVGVDPSPHAAAALLWAARLAAACGASLLVVHGQGLLEGSGLRPRFEIDRFVDATLGTLGEPDGSARPSTVTFTHPGPGAQALLAAAEDREVDLIVVGQRGEGGSARPLGSTSEWVLAHASVPVVVLPLRPAAPADHTDR
jgi:nucleotide-binding universal stress UspA family protein